MRFSSKCIILHNWITQNEIFGGFENILLATGMQFINAVICSKNEHR